MSEDKFTIVWKEDLEYELLYDGETIGSGRAPEELLVEYVELMNWAYLEGRNDKNK